MAYFIESNNETFANQLSNFATQLPAHKAVLGFSDPELEEALNDANFMQWTVKTNSAYENYAHAIKTFMHDARHKKGNAELAPPSAPVVDGMPKAVPSGIQPRFAQKAAKARAATGATETILKALGIVSTGSGGTSHPGEAPDLQVTPNAGYPELSFHLKGHSAVNIYKDSGTGSKFFKTLHHSSYKGTELPAGGQTAQFKYKAIYLVHDEETGAMSAEVSVAVVGR